MTTKRDLRMRENDLQRLLRGQFTIQSRLTQMRDELGVMLRSLDQLVLPGDRRGRSKFKPSGNVVDFQKRGPT